ncbi:MAG: 50S ribosomal protein L35 [Candidatus Andersenbacteria bacterium RIFCSPHIGHO2_12_FULL_45_11b]|uniref:Large ribosomal subunit protein bL35 n=1 Tax=Candidatus Andersenbacteria bacterium RIFCSPHIGHO2_12_FULL_45_11b TaxID=1797282 RepID=A0A1G1X9T6_9BACT|nr:MAG: 50S ribosomal protein L35 [Candidatus Andersenbacteria bacterium RIFCSPHIGHO2_12_FULL_45_11b]
MPKQKTKKSASKRFFFSSTGKVQRRSIGQAHFNGLDSGNQTRKKHNDKQIHPHDAGRISRLLPYA